MRRVLPLLIGVILLLPFPAPAEKPIKDLEAAYNSIIPMETYNYCKKLASDEYAGRLTGHEGYTAAAEWAAKKFKEWGLRSLGGAADYLQDYPSPYTVVDKAEMTLIIHGTDEKDGAVSEEMELEIGKDFLPLLFTDSGERTAGLVFAGWGISAPELGYDDYEGIDAAGKFVLCFRGTPVEDDEEFERHDFHRRRMNTAKEKGALGVVYIYPELQAHPNGDWIPGFTPAVINEKTADVILKEKGLSASELKNDLLSYKKPLSFPLGSEVRYKVASEYFPEGIGYNVAGYIEGSDSELRDECLVIGGHLDHCGRHVGMLFSGADDNASGSAVVMEIAEAFTKLPRRPRRSVVFVLFGGEERGLMGSRYFADHLPAGFNRADAMFNFDMNGEGEGTYCIVTPDPPELRETLERADEHVKTIRMSRSLKGVGVRSSDYAPFFLNGAGCIAFFSDGPHIHYHMPGDKIYRINPDILGDIARLGFLSAFYWADR